MGSTPAPNGNCVQITLNTRQTLGLDSSQLANRAGPVMQQLINWLQAGAAGGYPFDSIQIDPDTALSAQAFCTYILSGGSGSPGVVINGVSIAVAWTTDVATLAAIVAAINASANALLSGVVQAGKNTSATITCALPVAGDQVTVCGITLTAVSGTPNFRQFDISSANNTTIAANIAAALLIDPIVGLFYTAESAAAVVTVRPRYTSTVAPNPIGSESIGSSTTPRLAVTAFATNATPTTAISVMEPSALGNAATIFAIAATGGSLGIFASPATPFVAGSKLFQGGAGANSPIANAYYGRFS